MILVPASMLSRATSLSSMAQQLSQTAGVATAALLLHIVLTLRGGTTLAAADFYPVFVGVALISLLSVSELYPCKLQPCPRFT